MAEKSTCPRDAPGGIQQACLEVAKALGEQENLHSGASCNPISGLGLNSGEPSLIRL
jgi:hypothetical protein